MENHTHRTFLLTVSLVWAFSLMPMCMSADFGENCDNVNPCTGDLICSTTCQCASGFNYINDRCLETIYGGPCTTDADCTTASCLPEAGEGSPLVCTTVPRGLGDVSLDQYLDSFDVVFNITWVPGIYVGPTVYEVSVRGRDYFTENFSLDFVVITARGATGALVKNQVHGGLIYEVIITPSTAAGKGPQYKLADFISINSKPGLVENVKVIQDSHLAFDMDLTFNCPDKTVRNGNITAFIIRKTVTTGGGNTATTYTIPHNFVSDDCSLKINASQVGGLEVLNNYTFEVKIKNANYEGDYSSPVELFTNERPPRTSVSSLEKLLHPYKQAASKNPTSFKFEICASCLTNPMQGPIKAATIVICVQSTSPIVDCRTSVTIPDGSSWTKTIDSPDDINMYDTWATAKAGKFNTPYRTTSSAWQERFLQDNSESYIYEVGVDSNCGENDTTTFCNGPIPQDSKVSITVVVCNNAGCSETAYHDFNTRVQNDDDDDDDDDVIVGLAVGFGVVSVICICLIVYLFYIRASSSTSSMAI